MTQRESPLLLPDIAFRKSDALKNWKEPKDIESTIIFDAIISYIPSLSPNVK
jgi:hypothetical protein